VRAANRKKRATHRDRDVEALDELLAAPRCASAATSRGNNRDTLELDLAHALEDAARDARHVVKRLVELELWWTLVDRVRRGVQQVQGRYQAVDAGRVARELGQVSAKSHEVRTRAARGRARRVRKRDLLVAKHETSSGVSERDEQPPVRDIACPPNAGWSAGSDTFRAQRHEGGRTLCPVGDLVVLLIAVGDVAD
jgi:hypothetical protein